MPNLSPQDYLQQAELIYDEQAVANAISAMATRLNQVYANQSPVVLCVMGGAVFFTGQLLPQLIFPLEFDYVHATRYQSDTVAKELRWVVKPPDYVHGRHVLILDDILDQGVTLQAIQAECRRMGAASVKIAVLADKLLPECKPIQADFIGFSVPDRYVFGCGMDVHNWWRNLPAIYALKS